VKELARRGIGFRCLAQDIDTTSAGGHLIFTIFSAMAEFEREIIRERTCAGLDAARARGRKGGRPRKLKPKDIAAARALLRDPELTVEEVATRLGVAPSTLYASLLGGRSALSSGA
jgi:DNA invertase Pin-like site-specific DNA recombinase